MDYEEQNVRLQDVSLCMEVCESEFPTLSNSPAVRRKAFDIIFQSQYEHITIESFRRHGSGSFGAHIDQLDLLSKNLYCDNDRRLGGEIY